MRTHRQLALTAAMLAIASCAETGATAAVAPPTAELRSVQLVTKLDGGAAFTFDASFDAEGRPRGTWSEEIAPGVSITVAVSCLRVSGSDVWAAGTISTSDEPRFVGRTAAIRLSRPGTSTASSSYSLIDAGLSCEPTPIPTPGRLAQ